MGLRPRKVSIQFRNGKPVVHYFDHTGRRIRTTFETLEAAEKEKERVELAMRGFVSVNTPSAYSVTSTPSASPETSAKQSDITFREALRKYHEVSIKTRHMPRTQKLEKIHFEELALWLVNTKGLKDKKLDIVIREDKSDVLLRDVTLMHMDEFQARLTNGADDRKKLAGSTVNRMFQSYGPFFNKCVAWGLIAKSPMEGMTKAIETPPNVKPWTAGQTHVFLSALPMWASEVEFFLAESGRRPVDAERTVWRDWNFEDRAYRVVTYKGGTPFELFFPMSDRLHEFMLGVRERARRKFRAKPDDLVFVNSKGRAVNSQTLYQLFRKIRDENGLQGLTPYGLRHSFIDRLIDLKVHPRDVQVLAGHKKFETTTKYTHRKTDHLRDIVTSASDDREAVLNKKGCHKFATESNPPRKIDTASGKSTG